MNRIAVIIASSFLLVSCTKTQPESPSEAKSSSNIPTGWKSTNVTDPLTSDTSPVLIYSEKNDQSEIEVQVSPSNACVLKISTYGENLASNVINLGGLGSYRVSKVRIKNRAEVIKKVLEPSDDFTNVWYLNSFPATKIDPSTFMLELSRENGRTLVIKTDDIFVQFWNKHCISK